MSAELFLECYSDEIEPIDDALRYIDHEVDEFGRQEGWPDTLVFRVHLILEELGLNAMTYGGASNIGITITSEPETVTMEISDDGGPFDPLQDAPDPATDASLDDRPIGGLGVHLVRTLTEAMSYRRENDRNQLTLVVRRVA